MGNHTLSTSREHAYITLTPLNPTFMIVKLGSTGYTLFLLFQLKNIDCGYSLEPPRRAEILKISDFFLKIFILLVVKFSVYFNRHVFIMSEAILPHLKVYDSPLKKTERERERERLTF